MNPSEREQASDGTILVFLFSILASGMAEIRNLPTRMGDWLVDKGFVQEREDSANDDEPFEPDWTAFRGRIYRILGICGGYGIAILLYSLVLGSATGSPGMFLAKFIIGLVAFTGVWFVLVCGAFFKISRGLCFGILGISLLFAGIALDNQLPQLVGLLPDSNGIIHSAFGSVTAEEIQSGRHVMELEMMARAWALFGFFASMVMLVPFLFLGSISQALVGMIFNFPENTAKLIHQLGSEKAKEVHTALVALKQTNRQHLTRIHVWALGIGLMALACAIQPNFIGLMFVVGIALTTLITQSSRIAFGVTGHELSRWIHAGSICICLGSIALYLMYVAWSCWQMGPVACIICCVIFVALVILLPVLVKNTAFRVEREERRSGDVDYEPYKGRVTAVDGEGRPTQTTIVHPVAKISSYKFNMDWIGPLLSWAGLVCVVFAVLWFLWVVVLVGPLPNDPATPLYVIAGLGFLCLVLAVVCKGNQSKGLLGWAVTIAALAVVGVVLWSYFGKPGQAFASTLIPQGIPHPVNVAVIQPAALTVPPPVVGTIPSPLRVAEPTQIYLPLELSANAGRFQLDARLIWPKLDGLKLNAGDTIIWRVKGNACAAVSGGFYCEGPDGQPHVLGYSPWAGEDKVDPGDFPLGHAYYYALLMQVGSVRFQAGSSGSYTVPQGQQLDVAVMRNIRLPEISYATGGGEITVQVIRKK